MSVFLGLAVAVLGAMQFGAYAQGKPDFAAVAGLLFMVLGAAVALHDR